MGAVGFEDIRSALSARAPGESLTISKEDLPSLPPEFSETLLGTPNWIAHPGAVAQYRASPAIHAYEMSMTWEFHRDEFDPMDDPLRHFFFDAPELPIAAFAAAVAGFLTYVFFERKEREKDEVDRNPWFPFLVGLGVAALVGLVVYVIAALIRVFVGIG